MSHLAYFNSVILCSSEISFKNPVPSTCLLYLQCISITADLSHLRFSTVLTYVC